MNENFSRNIQFKIPPVFAHLNCMLREEFSFTAHGVMGRRIDPSLCKKEIFFNDALNTFYLRLHGVRHMVKDHSDSERGNPLPTGNMGLLFPISSIGFTMKDRSVYPSRHERTLLPRSFNEEQNQAD